MFGIPLVCFCVAGALDYGKWIPWSQKEEQLLKEDHKIVPKLDELSSIVREVWSSQIIDRLNSNKVAPTLSTKAPSVRVQTANPPSLDRKSVTKQSFVATSRPGAINNNNKLPSVDILRNLKCRPQASLQACLDHCLEVMRKFDQQTSSNEVLFYPRKLGLNLLGEKRWMNGTSQSRSPRIGDLPSERNSGGMTEDYGGGLEVWQSRELKSCIMGVCIKDYITQPTPGCLGADGSVIMTSLPDDHIRGPVEFNDYNFYNPEKLEFWKYIGFYNLKRVQHDLIDGDLISRMILIPMLLLIALALPGLCCIVVLPTLAAFGDSSSESENMRESLTVGYWPVDVVRCIGSLKGIPFKLANYFENRENNNQEEALLPRQPNTEVELTRFSRLATPNTSLSSILKPRTHGELVV